VDAIVSELKALATSFKPIEKEIEAPEHEQAESVVEASDSIARVRGKIDRIDEILHRLNG
jgi:ATP-dependent helicase/DNAse subunit B